MNSNNIEKGPCTTTAQESEKNIEESEEDIKEDSKNIKTVPDEEEMVDLSISEQQVNFPDVSSPLNELCDEKVDNRTGDVELLIQEGTPGEYFVTSTYEEMLGILEDYFDRTGSRFVVQKRTKDFGVKGANFNLYKHRIQWEDTKNPNMCYDYNFLPFDGVPHIIIGHYIMHCQFGQDASAAQKRKRRELKKAGKVGGKTRVLKYPTKKCGCPAKIHVKQVIKFPEYRIDKKTERRKRTGASRLKEKFLVDRNSILLDVYYMGRLPIIGEHKYHELMEGREFSKENVHKDLIIKAQELYMENRSINDIMAALHSHVITEMFYHQELPSKNRRKYYPSRKDIRNFIGRIRQISKLSKEEKKKISDLAKHICNDISNCGILFTFTEGESLENIDIESSDENEAENELVKSKPLEEKPEEPQKLLKEKVQTFLSCYQNPEQQRLLKRYGNTVTLIAEVRHNPNVKRALTFKMFLLLVQTNVDYQAVGSVVFSKQRENGLKNGLALLKERNVFWSPKYFLIDCNEEINLAVSDLFPTSEYFLNIKSCERFWLEFIRTPSNEVEQYSQEIMNYLNNMAYSYSEQSLTQSASHLEESDVWQKSDKLRKWFQSDWLPAAKKWVTGYRPDDFFIFEHLKYSIENCLEVYEQLVSNSTRYVYGIAGLFETLHNVVVKGEYQRYIERNIYAVQLGRDLKLDEILVDSLDGISAFLKPVVYETCKEAAISYFSVANTQQFGVFTVTVLPVKSISNILPPTTSTEKAAMESIKTLQNEMAVAEMIQGIKDINDSVMQVFNISEQVNTATTVQTSEFIQNSSIVTAASILANTNLNDIENVISEQDIETIGNCQDVVTTSTNITEELTISFGDSNSQPFCGCAYWKQFKLPCVHMFHIFQKVPGWKYDMLSPIYRINNVFHRDCTCVSSLNIPQLPNTNLKCGRNCGNVVKVAAQTQKNLGDYGIFLPSTEFSSSEKMFYQINDLIHRVGKLGHLFQDLVYFKNFQKQLTQLATTVRDILVKQKLRDNLSGEVNTLINEYLSSLTEKCISNQDLFSDRSVENNEKDLTVVINETIGGNAIAACSSKENITTASTTTAPSSSTEAIQSSNNNVGFIEGSSKVFDASIHLQQQADDNGMIMVPYNKPTTETTNISTGDENVVEINPLSSVPIVLEKDLPQKNKQSNSSENVVVLSTPVKAEHIIVSQRMSKTGIKRDSRILTDVSEDEKSFKKMSILEYLPLLKKKCVVRKLDGKQTSEVDAAMTTT